jgi:hypothetical protein|tara:strand:+ start:7057 stop:8988 length:1932 start_codon:yes stop_codon:yes gene_type:complete
MLYGILTLLSALTISAVAIYYSIAGLVAIFAAAAIPIIIMGTALEIGKLVTAVWLHKYWQQATWWLKTYLTTAVIVLMFITSMGIFGFLSKAHIEQTSAGEESVAQVERLAGEIERQQDIIVRAEEKIKKLETSTVGGDANIQSQIDAEQERIDKAYIRVQPAIDEQQKIIDSQATLYKNELAKIDAEMETLQGYIDSGDTKKAQQMIGASADGIFGKKTADKIGDWQEEKAKERNELIDKIERASNNPQAKAAAEEIKRLRTTVEQQIKDSNALINRLRNQLGDTDKTADIDAQVDAQNLRIKNANTEIDTLTDEKYALEGEYRKLEAEVGPIKYIAEFVYGENATQNMLEEAVRWVIIIIIFVFDPLAVLLLIASQYTFHWRNTGGSLPPKHDPDNDPDNTPTVTQEEWDEAHRQNYEFDRAKAIDANIPPDTEEKKESVISKKKTDQYLLWEDIDPEPQETVEQEEINPQKTVDPNQIEIDFDTEPKKKYTKTINPFFYADEKVNDVDDTIDDMKDKGQWPDQASKESQQTVTQQLEKIDDLDAWNSWVEKANEEAENNPEDFKQNSEQNENSVFNKINKARQNFDPSKIKELEITEEQYRDASQKHIISLIERLKDGLIKVDDLTETEANKITTLLDKN